MQVFKAYFKVIRKNIPQMMIYFGIFMALSIAFINAGVVQEPTDFKASKPNIAVLDRDETALSKALTGYLSLHSNRVEISDRENDIRDALFFRRVSYILIIEEGFSENFTLKNDQSPHLTRFFVPDSFHSAYLDRLIDKYLQTYEAYLRFLPAMNASDVGEQVTKTLSISSQVKMESSGTLPTLADNSIYYFNYFGYSLFAVILLGITSFMLTFRQPDLRRRNACSPQTARSMILQLLSGNIVFALAVWLLMFGMAFVLFGFRTLESKALFYGINTLTFMLVCVSISFLVAQFLKSKNAQPAVVNVLTLSMSFISGVFVPQFLLGETVLKMASLMPTYWYVRANHKINTNSTVSVRFSDLSDELFIQLAFAGVIFLVTFLWVRMRRTKPD